MTAIASPDVGRRPRRFRLFRSLLVLPVAVALLWFLALAVEDQLGVESAAFENLTFWIALAVPAISTYRNARVRAVQHQARAVLVFATLFWTALLLLLVVVFASPAG